MTRYFKLSGGGNDFLALAEPESDPAPEQIVNWCARGISEGADGLFVLERIGDGVAMRYFNADGRPAPLCLNGTRCAARLAFELGWQSAETIIETGVGRFKASEAGAVDVEIELPVPADPPAHMRLVHGATVWDCWRIDVGVPHLVVYWDKPIAEAPMATVGPALRRDPALAPQGANIDFAHFVDRHRLDIRTFERGVEAETLACGTGVVATVAVARIHGRADLPVTAMTLGGFEIRISASGDPSRWLMRGDARLVASGELAAGAGVRPEPPGW
jgi:diaminopimelate epimerase